MTNVARSLKRDCLVQLTTRILAGDERVEALRQDDSYVCAYCDHEERVSFKCGETVRAHFAHKANTKCWIENHEDWGKESDEHFFAKSWLCERIAEETGFATQIEAVVGDRERIADILVLAAQCSARVAVEVQLSHSPVEKFKERTESYARNNVDVVWLVGTANINVAKEFISVESYKKSTCSVYLIDFEENGCIIRSLSKISSHDPPPQKMMMMDILRFMLIRAKDFAKTGTELSNFLHGKDVDVVSYERFLNYHNAENRRVNPFDLVELDEKQRMRELLRSKIEDEKKSNDLARMRDKSELEGRLRNSISFEKERLAKNHLETISDNKVLQKDNAVVLICSVIQGLKHYKLYSFIKVLVRDPRQSTDRRNYFSRISIKIYNPFTKRKLEGIMEGQEIAIYGYIERVLKQNKEWETYIIADVVEIL